jgi:glycosyltransferase involved in cell wall biosynthesis
MPDLAPPVAISAIICTHNRAAYLAAAIDSLLAQDLTERGLGEFEVIVIDNASTDDSRAIAEARLGDPRFKYIYEPQLGLSHARNRGVIESRGAILAYLDDDAVASAHWLSTLVEAYRADETLAIAGGRVTLLWPEQIQPPAWVSDAMLSCLGHYDLGPNEITIENPSLTPRGLNYSLRRSFLDSVGGFDLQLGRVGKKLLSNEELYMTEAALKRGLRVAYLPHALVAHNVAPERLNRSWFLRRSWWQGVSECYRDQLAGRGLIGQFRVAGERLLRGLYKAVKFISQPAVCFDNLTYVYGQVGYLSTAMQNAVSTKS